MDMPHKQEAHSHQKGFGNDKGIGALITRSPGEEGAISAPLASVITPLHPIPLSLFERAYRSLLAQTCGFSRLERLIAFHHLEDDYVAAVKELVGDKENVLFLFTDEGDSPSVPRNLCFEIPLPKLIQNQGRHN